MTFRDRREAGERLTEALAPFRGEHPAIVGLLSGGLVVAAEVAREMDAPLDIAIARALTASARHDVVIGAVAPGGIRVVDEIMVRALRPGDDLDALAQRASEEAGQEERRLRGGRPAVELEGRTAILVAEGVIDGLVARAALGELRLRKPRRLLFAVPVAKATLVDAFAHEADDVVMLEVVPGITSLSVWYEDFSDVSDEVAREILVDHRTNGGLPSQPTA